MRLFLATTALALLASSAAFAEDARGGEARAAMQHNRPNMEQGRQPAGMVPREKWESMSPQQREAWKKEHPEAARKHKEFMERRAAMKEKWQGASPEEREKMKAQWQEKHPEAAEQMEKKREAWKNASPEQRERMRAAWKDKQPQGGERMKMQVKNRPAAE